MNQSITLPPVTRRNRRRHTQAKRIARYVLAALLVAGLAILETIAR